MLHRSSEYHFVSLHANRAMSSRKRDRDGDESRREEFGDSSQHHSERNRMPVSSKDAGNRPSYAASSHVSPADRLLSRKFLERYNAALQSYNAAVKKNPSFRGVNVDVGLGPYYFLLRRWLVETKRVRNERSVDDEVSTRLIDDLCDFAVEYNELKLSVDYYSAAAVEEGNSTTSGGKLTFTERVRRATHSGKWMDVSVPEERWKR